MSKLTSEKNSLLSVVLRNVSRPKLQKVLERGEGHVETIGECVAEKEDEELVIEKGDAVVHLKLKQKRMLLVCS